jgi:hypothetical protein
MVSVIFECVISGNVAVACGGDTYVVSESVIQFGNPSRDTLPRDSIKHLCMWETFKEIFLIH